MTSQELKKATFAAGCFWGVEEAFRILPGVEETVVGYMGGHKTGPTYEDVCTDKTGHAEVVQITYDPEKISYNKLLEVFWDTHNPTQHNRQGPDVGSQYRSEIFYHSTNQKELAQASKEALGNSGKFQASIATEITPASTFYKAEDYHQKYLLKKGKQTC